jgi:hypothetical protein
MNFYLRFVPKAARFHRPLTEALKGSSGPKTMLAWTEEMRTTFQAAKGTLCSTTGLAFSRPQAELSLMVDTSAEHVGTALQQWAGQPPPGSRWDSSLGSWTPPKSSTPPTSGSYWSASRGSATSASCWRAGGSRSTQTTSHSLTPSPRGWNHGHLGSATSSAMWWNSQATSAHRQSGQCGGGHPVTPTLGNSDCRHLGGHSCSHLADA